MVSKNEVQAFCDQMTADSAELKRNKAKYDGCQWARKLLKTAVAQARTNSYTKAVRYGEV